MDNLCPFCKLQEATIDIEGLPLCPKCLIVFGGKFVNAKLAVKIAKMTNEMEEIKKQQAQIIILLKDLKKDE